MNTKLKAAAAALVFSTLVALPMTAKAGTNVQPGISGLHALWAIGFVACTGITFIKQDRDAAAKSTTVSDRARLRALAGCAFPPLGFVLLHHPKYGYDK